MKFAFNDQLEREAGHLNHFYPLLLSSHSSCLLLYYAISTVDSLILGNYCLYINCTQAFKLVLAIYLNYLAYYLVFMHFL